MTDFVRDAWYAAAERLDGSGHAAATVVDELLELVEGVLEPLSAQQGEEMERFVAGAVGLGLRLRLSALPSLALRLESYASFAGKAHGTTVPTFLGGELWF